ncbi:transcriptional regulator [Sporolactobacillus sp. THM7-4]|nr:transcriptional regulator [Sporolactobacillus sp. THM7-4]
MFFFVLMIFIGGAFLAQLFFGYFQVRHFSHVFVQMRRKGKVAIGRKKGNLRSGTIVFLAVDPHGEILDAKKMQGVTVIARFRSMKHLIGENIQSISAEKLENDNNLVRLAINDAVHNYKIVAEGGKIEENHGSPLFNASIMVKSIFQKSKKAGN